MTIARQADLPGMENRKLKDVHEAALVYAEARDARVAASAPEIKAKQDLLELMKKHKVEHYKFDNVECDITHEKENVRVRVRSRESSDESNGEATVDEAVGMPELPAEQKRAVKRVKTKKKKGATQ